MKVVIVDNYDSFTYNLYQYVGEILEAMHEKFTLDVIRNNEIEYQEFAQRNYDKIIISPGPGTPEELQYFGICSDILLKAAQNTPTLGICLGMQGLAFCYGGSISKAKLPMHGKVSLIHHSEKDIFKDLPQEIEVMRYHSLIVEKESVPESLEITANTIEDKPEVMGLKHKSFPIWGVQFHPESFATEGGKQLLKNFLSL